MKFTRPGRPQPKVRFLYSIASVNIMLVLMVFIYLLPSELSYSGVSIETPRIITAEPISEKGHVIIIADNNSIFVDGRNVPISGLKSFLSSGKFSDLNVLIKADKEAGVGTLARVWDICRDSGIRKVTIATN